MIDALLITLTAFATGFAAAWALGSRTRVQLAEVKVRAEEQALATEDKLELVAEARSSLANAFKALSAEALQSSNESFLQLATAKRAHSYLPCHFPIALNDRNAQLAAEEALLIEWPRNPDESFPVVHAIAYSSK
jgi:hypothetical protein